MGRLHVVGGEKGGVGRSLLARVLAQYWIDRGRAWAGFDTDRSSGTFRRHHADRVRFVDPRDEEQLDRIVEVLDDGTPEVVVDLAAQSQSDLDGWMERAAVLDLLEELGHETWLWWVTDDSEDSVHMLREAIRSLDERVRLACVLNRERGGEGKRFRRMKLHESIERRGGHLLALPALAAGTMRRLDARPLGLRAALRSGDPKLGPPPKRMQRQRALLFLAEMSDQLDDALRARTVPTLAARVLGVAREDAAHQRAED